MLAAFACGAVVAAVGFSVGLLSYARNQSRLVWLELLKREVRVVRHLHAGRSEELASVTARGLPGVAQSIASFGIDETTGAALRDLRGYYHDAGVPVPAELQTVFASLD